jgi:hypothetical protein
MSVDLYTHAVADSFRLAKSKRLVAPSDETYNVIHIPRYALVMDVWVLVTSQYVGGGQVSVGWRGNKQTAQGAGFISTDIFLPSVIGLKRAIHDTVVSNEGKYFGDASGAITVTVVNGVATTKGTFIVFATWSIVT